MQILARAAERHIPQTVNNVTQNLDELMARIYNLDESFFKEIDTEEKAYILGFCMGDGAVDDKRYSLKIDLHDKDADILHKIKAAMGFGGTVKQYTRWTGDTYSSLRMCSKQMIADLVELGCTPRKSFTVTLPDLNDVVIKHFIRGLTCADGSIMTKKSGSNTYPRYALYGNEELLLAVKYVLEEMLDLELPNVNAHSSIWSFDVSGKKALKIMNYIYEDATIFLDRKFNKYQELMA